MANQKGGVAKTTTVASIGAALAERGHKVLLVDLDPQACLTFSLGVDPEDLELSVHHVLTKGLAPGEAILETEDGVDLLPATIELARAEADLLTRTGREHVLAGVVADLDEAGAAYDWILLDCPPSLGVLTVAALTAAQGVLIPLQCETLSHRGVGQLLDTVHDVRRFTNRDLEVWGVLPTLYDGRTNHSRTVLETISDTYDLDVIEPPDPQDDQVRRGAGPGPVDPGDQPQQQGRPGLPRGGRQPGQAGGRAADEPPPGAARATLPGAAAPARAGPAALRADRRGRGGRDGVPRRAAGRARGAAVGGRRGQRCRPRPDGPVEPRVGR